MFWLFWILKKKSYRKKPRQNNFITQHTMRGFWAATEPSEVEIDFPFSPVRKWVCACQRMAFLHLPQSHLPHSHLPPTPLISVPSSTSKQCGVIKLEALMERFLRRKRARPDSSCCSCAAERERERCRKLTGGGFSADAMLLEKEDILFLTPA